MTDTSDLSEIELRRLQPTEIRAMLGLLPSEDHQTVIRTLWEIARAVKRIDGDAIPDRYKGLVAYR